jgi:C1A family cysteine protease
VNRRTVFAMLRVSALLLVGVSADVQQEWKDFKIKYGKQYNGIDEEGERAAIFSKNYEYIVNTNAQNLTYKVGVNQFSDLTADEVAAQYTGLKPKNMWADLPHLGTMTYSGKVLADSVDWSTQGAVTPVKNQGQCGSCWSFSTTGSLEGAWKIAGNTLTSLSEQQFVDCDKVSDQGCNGGLMDNAFKFAEKNAICTEASYPYKGVDGTCASSSCTVGIPKGDVKGFKDVSSNEQAMMEAVMLNPVSIAIEADKSAFQSYRSGVLSSTCGTSLDHGVLAVGYGTDNGVKYWKVKNSWGTTYGEDGYVRLLRGKGGVGECGILSQPSYPVVSGSADSIVV